MIFLRILIRLSLAFAALVVFDSLLFRTGWYFQWLEPDSSTAAYDLLFRDERDRQKQDQRQILVVGDSRMGFLSRVAHDHGRGKGYRFANVGLGGASPRCWYYMIRELDPKATVYDAVVVPLNDYEDEEMEETLADRTADLNYVIGFLGMRDIAPFVRSYPTWDSRWYALRASLLRGFVLKKDLQMLLENPKQRILQVRAVEHWYEWVYNYEGEKRSLDGMQVDWKDKKITFPPGVPEASQQATRDRLLHDPIEPRGNHTRYLRQWLGRIAGHYADSKTRVIFFRLPRGPMLRPPEWRRPAGNVVSGLAGKPEVVLADENLFNSIEQPKYFIDGMHLNGEGMTVLSKGIAELVWNIVPPPAGGRS